MTDALHDVTSGIYKGRSASIPRPSDPMDSALSSRLSRPSGFAAKRFGSAPWKVAGATLLVGACLALGAAHAATAGALGLAELTIVGGGRSDAIVVRAPTAGKWERAAADDLVSYIAEMTGVTLPIADTSETIAHTLRGDQPLIILGQEALAARPDLNERLAAVLKPSPVVRTEAVALLHDGNRVYVAGNDDEANYFARGSSPLTKSGLADSV